MNGDGPVAVPDISRQSQPQLEVAEMAKNDSGRTRRVRVERNIYRRSSGVYEIGCRDANGKQRWQTVEGGITAARALLGRVA